MESENMLVKLDNLNAVELFVGGGLDIVLARIREEAAKVQTVAETAKDRQAIKSMAYKVAQSKTFLDDMGKSLVAEQKAQIAKVDAERKRCRDELDELKDKVRRPLTEWEEAQERAQAIIDGIRTVPAIVPRTTAGIKAEQEKILLARGAKNIPANLTAEYRAAIDRCEAELAALLSDTEKREAEQAELARLKAEAEARQREEREEALRKEGETRARLEAERAIADAAARAERQKQAAIEDERRAMADAERLRREVQAEQERVERERREDATHREDVETNILTALVFGGVPRVEAAKVLALARKGKAGALVIAY